MLNRYKPNNVKEEADLVRKVQKSLKSHETLLVIGQWLGDRNEQAKMLIQVCGDKNSSCKD